MTKSVSAQGFTLNKDQAELINRKLSKLDYADSLIIDLILHVKEDKKFYFDATVNFRWGGNGLFGGEVLLPLVSGGLMLGAFFMATDWVTTPTTAKGEIIFALGCGFFTFIIRCFGSLAEGVSLAILLMNMVSPTIDRFCKAKKFGYVKPPKKEKEAKA